MKKLLSCILTVCFVMSILVGNSLVKADDYSPFGAVEKTVIENVVYAKVELENDDISDYYMVDSFIDSKENIDKITEINIVDKIGDLPVTVINAYASATEGTDILLDVTKITLPDTIKNIGAYSFYNFKKLTNINLPDSLKSIDDYAFCGMTSLKKVQLPKNITVIGKGAVPKL